MSDSAARPTRHIECNPPGTGITTVAPLSRWQITLAAAPGLCLATAIGILAFTIIWMTGLAALSPLVIAAVSGMTFHNIVGTPERARPGVLIALRPLLRTAIVLLGLQLTFSDLLAIGGQGLILMVLTVLATLFFTKVAGRLIGVDSKLTKLIAVGTAICGASAVIATNAVIKARDEDVAYAIACITVFGSFAMLAGPFLGSALHLSQLTYGVWIGASVHEVAQAVAAAFQYGSDAGEIGTAVKLSRVIMLAPALLALSAAVAFRAHKKGLQGLDTKVSFPWFVLGFIAMIGFNSLDLLPSVTKSFIVHLTTFMFTVALAAMGLETDISKLKKKGLRPLFLGASAWIFVSAFSLFLVFLMFS